MTYIGKDPKSINARILDNKSKRNTIIIIITRVKCIIFNWVKLKEEESVVVHNKATRCVCVQLALKTEKEQQMVVRFPNIITLTRYPIYYYTIIIYVPPAILLSLTITEVWITNLTQIRSSTCLPAGQRVPVCSRWFSCGTRAFWRLVFRNKKIENSRCPDTVERTRVCEAKAREVDGRKDACRDTKVQNKKKKNDRRYGEIRTTVRAVNGPTK